ncbi:MAG: zinc-binding dehydrogenase [Candidatus Eremiobacteraeota bacterium]|nr:zinc-binding dehydrogenase [Candidatus Eremiobacteraeota bacterium]
MKAVTIEHHGDRGTLRDVDVPAAGPHDVLVRVTAVGVNPIDWRRRDRPDTRLLHVLGQDFAGFVSDIGDRVTKYHKGERVFGIAPQHGSYAEYTLVPQGDRAQPLAKIPDDVGDADAAALPTAGITALAAIQALNVTKATSLLVLGATGGVGGTPFRSRTIAAPGSSAPHVRRTRDSRVRSAWTSSYPTIKEDAARRLRGRGMEAALDLVDDKAGMKRIAGAMREGGRIVSTIGAADTDWFAARKIAATNLYAADTAQWSHAGLRALLEMLQQGGIKVMIAGERPLSEAAQALKKVRAAPSTEARNYVRLVTASFNGPRCSARGKGTASMRCLLLSTCS